MKGIIKRNSKGLLAAEPTTPKPEKKKDDILRKKGDDKQHSGLDTALDKMEQQIEQVDREIERMKNEQSDSKEQKQGQKSPTPLLEVKVTPQRTVVSVARKFLYYSLESSTASLLSQLCDQLFIRKKLQFTFDSEKKADIHWPEMQELFETTYGKEDALTIFQDLRALLPTGVQLFPLASPLQISLLSEFVFINTLQSIDEAALKCMRDYPDQPLASQWDLFIEKSQNKKDEIKKLYDKALQQPALLKEIKQSIFIYRKWVVGHLIHLANYSTIVDKFNDYFEQAVKKSQRYSLFKMEFDKDPCQIEFYWRQEEKSGKNLNKFRIFEGYCNLKDKDITLQKGMESSLLALPDEVKEEDSYQQFDEYLKKQLRIIRYYRIARTLSAYNQEEAKPKLTFAKVQFISSFISNYLSQYIEPMQKYSRFIASEDLLELMPAAIKELNKQKLDGEPEVILPKNPELWLHGSTIRSSLVKMIYTDVSSSDRQTRYLSTFPFELTYDDNLAFLFFKFSASKDQESQRQSSHNVFSLIELLLIFKKYYFNDSLAKTIEERKIDFSSYEQQRLTIIKAVKYYSLNSELKIDCFIKIIDRPLEESDRDVILRGERIIIERRQQKIWFKNKADKIVYKSINLKNYANIPFTIEVGLRYSGSKEGEPVSFIVNIPVEYTLAAGITLDAENLEKFLSQEDAEKLTREGFHLESKEIKLSDFVIKDGRTLSKIYKKPIDENTNSEFNQVIFNKCKDLGGEFKTPLTINLEEIKKIEKTFFKTARKLFEQLRMIMSVNDATTIEGVILKNIFSIFDKPSINSSILLPALIHLLAFKMNQNPFLSIHAGGGLESLPYTLPKLAKYGPIKELSQFPQSFLEQLISDLKNTVPHENFDLTMEQFKIDKSLLSEEELMITALKSHHKFFNEWLQSIKNYPILKPHTPALFNYLSQFWLNDAEKAAMIPQISISEDLAEGPKTVLKKLRDFWEFERLTFDIGNLSSIPHKNKINVFYAKLIEFLQSKTAEIKDHMHCYGLQVDEKHPFVELIHNKPDETKLDNFKEKFFFIHQLFKIAHQYPISNPQKFLSSARPSSQQIYLYPIAMTLTRISTITFDGNFFDSLSGPDFHLHPDRGYRFLLQFITSKTPKNASGLEHFLFNDEKNIDSKQQDIEAKISSGQELYQQPIWRELKVYFQQQMLLPKIVALPDNDPLIMTLNNFYEAMKAIQQKIPLDKIDWHFSRILYYPRPTVKDQFQFIIELYQLSAGIHLKKMIKFPDFIDSIVKNFAKNINFSGLANLKQALESFPVDIGKKPASASLSYS